MAFQDPPADFAFAVTADYDVWYQSDRPINENWLVYRSGASSRAQARQKSRGKGPKAKDASFKLSKVCFLVSKSIAVSSYRIQGVQALACGDNMDLVAVLELQTNSGVLSIINFHNPNEQLHIRDLGYMLPENGFYVLLGDSNVHHSLWGEPPGTITYARAEAPGGVQSSIDVCFTGPAIQYCDTHWSEQLIDGIDSDHFAFATHLSAVTFELNEETVLDYRNVDKSKMRQMSRDGLLELGTPPLHSTARIESYAMGLLRTFRSAQDASVPRKRRFNRRAQLQDSAKAKRQRKAFHEARAESKKRCQSKRRMRLWWRRRRLRVRNLLNTRRIDGIVSFRDRIRRESDENNRIFRLARAGREWCLRRRLAHIKTLHDNKGTHETPSAKIHAVLRYNFPGGHARRWKDSRNASTLELPPLEGRSEKAAGKDEIRGELFTIIADIVVPYLEHLFAACLRFSYHPEAFRVAVTILLPKPGRRNGDVPKDLRPISLLSILGKMLERIVATRLRKLCEAHALLPTEQFGFAGRCTTSAQQYLLNHVFRGWLLELKVTLLSLDMSAAFDKVPRHKLLKILAGKGIPGWIIRFIHSFLSRRSTYFRIPGYTSKEFWINVGVPQGSPLSPILFLIFAAPLLEELKLEGALSKAGEMANFAFHDDGYFLVSSRNFKTNCRIIEQLHERLLRWADDNGASFSPVKYGVMHSTDPNPRPMNEPCRLLPKIPGLPPDGLKLSQRILGIIVDHQLGWNDQINDIEDKVTRRVAYLKRISGKTWGPTLGHMIQLYKSMVRPLFSNGCAAWFSYAIDGFHIKWRLGKGRINRLVKIEDRCLRQISGVFGGTCFDVVRKQLSMESVDIFLYFRHMSFRIQRLRSPEQKKLRENRIRPTRLASASVLANAIDKHPYQALDAIAMDYRAYVEDEFGWAPGQEESDLDWRWPKRKKHFMKTWRQRSNNGKHYPSFKNHPVIPRPVALEQPWSAHCVDYCKGMSRAESTLYLQMVSGKIGLRGYLSTWRDVERTGPHTVDHIFIHCPLLAAEREELRHELGHLDLKRMLTDNALASTRWALQHFGLEQFQWERENQLVRMALQCGSELKKP
ncbi:hypothetical protein PG988_011391 [Apiospora saccharicola]